MDTTQLLQRLLVNALQTGGGAYDPASCLAAAPSAAAAVPTPPPPQPRPARSSSASRDSVRGGGSSSAPLGRRSNNLEVMLPEDGGGGGSKVVAMEAHWKPLSRSTDPTAWSVPPLLSMGRQHIGTAKVSAWWPRPAKGAPKPPKHFWLLNPPRNDKASWNSFREASAFLVDKNSCLKRTLPDGVEVAILHTSSHGVASSGMGKLPSKSLIAVAFDHCGCMKRAPESAADGAGAGRGTKRRAPPPSAQTQDVPPPNADQPASKRAKPQQEQPSVSADEEGQEGEAEVSEAAPQPDAAAALERPQQPDAEGQEGGVQDQAEDLPDGGHASDASA